MKLYYGLLEFCIIPPLSLSKSSKEVVYSNIEIDFTGHTFDELPNKYQKIEIKDADMNLIYTGYTDEIITPELNEKDGLLHLTLSVLSPQSYATKRLIDYNFTGSLTTIITTICQPLIDDGYTLNLNIEEREGSFESNFYSIEKSLNLIAKKYHMWWYIDELLNIYVEDIKKINDSVSMYTINETSKITNLQSKIDSNEYCNKIVAKNVFVYHTTVVPPFTELLNGETYYFNYPIHFSELGTLKLRISSAFNRMLTLNTDDEPDIILLYDKINQNFVYSSNFGYLGEDDDDPTKIILFIRDQFITNKIIGFKWNGVNTNITNFNTNMEIRPYTVEMLNIFEINNAKGIVSPSGIMEKIIDLNGKYYEEWELIEFMRNLFTSNKTEVSEVSWIFKDFQNLPNLNIGNKITFVLDKFLVNGDFIITNEEKIINNTVLEEVKYSARNINLNEDYLDIFRSVPEQEDNEGVKEAIKSFYIEETTNEVHEFVVGGVIQ